MKPIECPPWAQGIQYVVQYSPRSTYPAQEFSPWPISVHSADWIGIENAMENSTAALTKRHASQPPWKSYETD